MALDDAVVVPRAGATEIRGAALEELAREYLLAEAVVNRLSHLINPEVLHALIDGNLELVLDDQASSD